MKQRLVGAIVLGCLAIIFIPVLLDGEGVTPSQMTLDIPSAPVTPPIPQIEPVRPVVLSDTDDLNFPTEAALPANGSSAEAPISSLDDNASAEIVEVARVEQPRLGGQGLPESWSVRLASFGEKANAEGLIVRLVDDNYSAYSRVVETSQGRLTAVFVGPLLTRTEAASLQVELEDKFDLSGIVVQFTIEEMEQ